MSLAGPIPPDMSMRNVTFKMTWAAGLLARLRRDRRGNAMMIAAAAMLPLAAMTGSAVDMGRAYLVKTRLQQACDAGALAARKSITQNELNDTARTQGMSFFNINLRSGMYGAKNVAFALSDVTRVDPVTRAAIATGTVHGRASADVPMAVMQYFGFGTINMVASCETELNVANNDIMFVLDTTGSMACLPGDSLSNCQSYVVQNTANNPFRSIERSDSTGQNGSRIEAVRDAVEAFFATVNAAQAPGTRLRIGFVPYASNVNVGGLLPSNTMVASRAYDTRTANFNTAHWRRAQTQSSPTDETYGTFLTTENCDKYANNQQFSQTGTYATTYTPNPTGNPTQAAPAEHVYGGSKPANVTSISYAKVSWAAPQPNNNTTNKTCKRRKTTTTYNYDTPATYQFTNYSYAPQTLSLANYLTTTGTGYDGNAVQVATAIVESGTGIAEVPVQGSYTPLQLAARVAAGGVNGVTVENSEWDGCVEERLGGNADIDGAADSDSMRWAPTWPMVTYNRPGTANVNNTANDENTANYWMPKQSANGYLQSGYFCPRAAQQLQVMTAAQVNAYVRSPFFVPSGFTYHDIGMIWAARLMSTNSVFGGNFGPAPNGKPVTRHIIFMTDGDMETNVRAYTPYGIEAVDKRISGNSTTALNTLHNNRFQAACSYAKNNAGVSVWVIAFGQALTTNLTNCASSSTQALQASTTSQLNTAFANIAARIADLRLTS